MNTPAPEIEETLAGAVCESCGERLPATGVCGRCLFLEFDVEPGARFSLPGLDALEELARGGMGVVYKAREIATGRIVAVKVPGTRMWENAEAMRRFSQEVKSAALLDHPHVLPVYEVSRTSDAPFFTMKFAGGGTLAEQSKRARADRFRWIAQVIAKVAEAVQFAHERGVLHRDLKPQNILFDDAGEPFVADFGLAKWVEGSLLGEGADLTRTITALGTPHYLAPEIAGGRQTAASTGADVYALGAILYELLCGKVPHEGSSITLVLRNVADRVPDAPSRVTDEPLPRDLEAVCLKAMQREPQDRYASAGALADDLRRFIAGESVTARPLPWPMQTMRWARRHPALAGVSAALVLVLVVSGVMIVSANRRLSGALGTSNARLHDSLIAQSRFVRRSGHAGQRGEALELIRKAAAMGSSVELRNEAAAALATPDVQPAGELFRFRSTRRIGSGAAITPDFSRSLCIGVDGITAVREIGTGKVLWRREASDKKAAVDFQLSDSGEMAALIFADHSFEVWNTRADELLLRGQIVPLEKQSLYHANALPFCLHAALPLIAWADEDGTVQMRDLATRRQIEIIKNRPTCAALRFDPEGRTLMVAAGKNVDGYSIPEAKRSFHFAARETGSAASWDAHTLLFTDFSNREIEVVEDGEIKTSFRGPDSPPELLDHVRGSRFAVTISNLGTAALWDTRNGHAAWEMKSGASLLRVHEGGRAIALETQPGRAVKWERADDRVFREFYSERNLSGVLTQTRIELSADGRLAATFMNAWLMVWDLRRDRAVSEHRINDGDAGVSGAFAPDDSALFASRLNGDGIHRYAIEWQNDEPRMVEGGIVPGSERMHLRGISPDGRTWAVRTPNLRYCRPDDPAAAFVSPVNLLKPNAGTPSPALGYVLPVNSPSGNHVVWNSRTGLPHIASRAKGSGSLLMSRDEKWLALRQNDVTRFIDVATWNERGTWPNRIGAGYHGAVAISPDGRLAAHEEADDVIEIFTLPDFKLLVRLEPPRPITTRGISFTNDSSRLLVLGVNHRLFEWDLKALNEELAKLGLGW